MVVSQDILSCPGKVQLKLLKAKFPPTDYSEASVKGDFESECKWQLWEKTKTGRNEIGAKRRKEWGGSKSVPSTSAWRQERQVPRLAVCLFVYVSFTSNGTINQRLLSFKSIFTLTNTMFDQSKMKCNTFNRVSKVEWPFSLWTMGLSTTAVSQKWHKDCVCTCMCKGKFSTVSL